VRLRTLTIALAIAVLAAVMLAAPAFAKDPSVPQVKKWLGHARQVRQRAGERAAVAAADLAGAKELYAQTSAAASTTPAPAAGVLAPPAGMDQTVAAGLLADGVVTADEVAALQTRLTTAQHKVHRWDLRARKLKRRLHELRQIAAWNERSQWKPLIAIASQRYHVSAAGLTHMMTLESNGQRRADSGPYHGLFQFMDREWAMSWNEWRDHSIYDGWSQIQLAAKCISRGMGPSIWPLTYRMSF
jgi:hypothetical protein